MRGTAPHGRGLRLEIRFIPAHAGNSVSAWDRRRIPAVHPRACGEQARRTARWGRDPGSSPRMRGTGPAGLVDHRRRRFIPAHAGNRIASSTGVHGRAVHPRACGEQQKGMTIEDAADGSSPRMRGTGPERCRGRARLRFIPAHAGNSSPRQRWLKPLAVHPRACGEQRPFVGWVGGAAGSSPRMRGTVLDDGHPDPDQRFIPAHAGNRRGLVR